MIEGTLHIEEKNRKDLLIIFGLVNVMQEAKDCVNCCSIPSSSHLLIMQ